MFFLLIKSLFGNMGRAQPIKSYHGMTRSIISTNSSSFHVKASSNEPTSGSPAPRVSGRKSMVRSPLVMAKPPRMNIGTLIRSEEHTNSRKHKKRLRWNHSAPGQRLPQPGAPEVEKRGRPI